MDDKDKPASAEHSATLSDILIIDDHPLFRTALAGLLEAGFVAARTRQANSFGQAMEQIKARRPDLVSFDLMLPDVSGLSGLVRLRAAVPDVPVIIVSSLADRSVVRDAIAAGASGFVPKISARDVYEAAVRAVMAGEVFLPDDLAEDCAPDAEPGAGETFPECEAAHLIASLTPQQDRILKLVCEGKPNKQIAFETDIAETTVKAHLTAILRKLKVKSRTQAALLAQRARLDTGAGAPDRTLAGDVTG